jgi:hypothetical protein
MTLNKAKEYLAVQADLGSTGSGYNRNAAKLILAEVQKEHGIEAANDFISEFNLDELFDLQKDIQFTR